MLAGVDRHLVDVSNAQRTATLNLLIGQCAEHYACVECQVHRREESSHLCRTVQLVYRLLAHSYTNCTMSHFRDCRWVCVSHLFLIKFYFTRNIASRLSPNSALMLSGLYPTSLKRLAYRLEELETACSLSRHLPSYASGKCTVFALLEGGKPVEAVNYIDGDGGTINVAMFPGLQNYAFKQGISCHHLRVPSMALLSFREKYHDAIELGHQYTITLGMHNIHLVMITIAFVCHFSHPENTTPVTKEFGYLALVHARSEIGRAARILLTVHGVHRGQGGDLLLAEVHTSTERDSPFFPSGLRRVRDGLSFPTEDAPTIYRQALDRAVEVWGWHVG